MALNGIQVVPVIAESMVVLSSTVSLPLQLESVKKVKKQRNESATACLYLRPTLYEAPGETGTHCSTSPWPLFRPSNAEPGHASESLEDQNFTVLLSFTNQPLRSVSNPGFARRLVGLLVWQTQVLLLEQE